MQNEECRMKGKAPPHSAFETSEQPLRLHATRSRGGAATWASRPAPARARAGPGRRRHAEGPAPQAPASLALAVIDSRSGRSGRGLVSGLPSSEKLRLKLYATAVSAKSRALRSRPRYLAHE